MTPPPPPHATNEIIAVDGDGFASSARFIKSPNCDSRPDDSTVELIVLHGISLPPGEFIGDAVERLFLNSLDCESHPYYAKLRGLRVSSHFFIRRGGGVIQFVSCNLRAWHAGESQWRGRGRCNDFSVGVEIEGAEAKSPTAMQYQKLTALIRGLIMQYPIKGIAGHCDIAPGRKDDPADSFNWKMLFAAVGEQYDGRA